MLPRLASRLWWRRYLRRNARPWNELEQFPALRPDQQRKDLARRLYEQIQYFGRREDALPEWREAAQIRDPDEMWRLWPSLPILCKTTLQTKFPAVEIKARFGLAGRVNSTGGSTGEPVSFFHDMLMLRSALAASIYTCLRMGWQPGMPTIIVWGSERDIGKETSWRNRLHGRLRNEYLLDGYRMMDATVDRVVEIASRLRPVAIYGFSSMLKFVAQRVLESRQVLPAGSVRAAWCGGEMLFSEQIEVFRQAFGVAILNRYGGRELSVMACQFEEGGPLQVLRPWLFLEVVNDQGKPAVAGEPGKLIWTSTVCRGTPFLRYEIEDIGVFAAMHQNEAGIFAIEELQGRVAGLLELADGRKINNIYWNHLFKEFREVRQFQVVIKDRSELRILLKGGGFTPRREVQLRDTLHRFLGDLPIQICWVEEIPRTSQGKLIQVVRERTGL
jgi:phenylacetate-CoA ligase